MKIVLRKDESGVSEVVGTILILAMTVVLFASIIVWVTSIPTPQASTRLEIEGTLEPYYVGGIESGATITLRHNGGESLDPVTTIIYVSTKRGASTSTEILRTKGTHYTPPQAYGLIDGGDNNWNVGERWQMLNQSIRASTDTVTVTIVDSFKSLVLWTQQLTPPVGTRPPIIVEKWADSLPETASIDAVESGVPFYVFAKISDPDGDLNPDSVYGVLTMNYPGPGLCAEPIKMEDNGRFGDQKANDGIFRLYEGFCMNNPDLLWDGGIILINATDQAGHMTLTRLILNVIPGPGGDEGGGGNGSTGRPQNLRWNGRQGYNIFNATQWDRFKYTARETRTFAASEEVVVVVGSLDLENVANTNQFTMWDPYSGTPADSVVYGTDKTIDVTSQPSTSRAFVFLEFINGYYIYAYRFHLNDPATVGTNFERVPLHPPNYYFARYSLDILLASSSAIRFNTTDSINITDSDGYMRDFPQVQTYADPGFTQMRQTFNSTDVVYVQMKMFTVDPILTNVIFGNIVIKDYQGGTQLWRSPANGHDANQPICPISGACSGPAVTIVGPLRVYRFAINLSRANQDPWVEGQQNYALTVTSIRDSDEFYSQVSTQLVIMAPLYKLDVVIGNDDTTSNAWGTHDYSYYYENVNGFDRWRAQRVEYCGLAGTACSSLEKSYAVAYLDFDQDGDLDVVGSFFIDNSNAQLLLFRRDLDATGNVIFTRFVLENLVGGTYVKAIGTGDVTGDAAAEVVVGATSGHIWYYKNDGSWQGGSATKVMVDTSRTQSINALVVGDFNGDHANDIAVGGASGRLTWYPNLDGLGRFQNTGIVDNWFSDGEQVVKGTISGSYLNTYSIPPDQVYEQATESVVTEPVQTGLTTNPGFDSGTAGWEYRDWVEPGTAASGAWQNSNGNPGGYDLITTNFVANQVVAGYFFQAFNVTGSAPFTATLNLNWRVPTFGSATSITLYAFVDTNSDAPILGQQVWTSGALSGTTTWAVVSGIDASSRITQPGTYYVKIAVRTQSAPSGSLPSEGGYDNVQLSWSSTGGAVSELEHYWRFTALPVRPGTTFTFKLTARHSTSTEGDNFVFAYSTNVLLNDPTTGTYTTMLWVNVTTDQSYSLVLPASVAGKIVWVRALDTERTVGGTNLDTLFVDTMYIEANTPAAGTGASLTNPGDGGAVNALGAGDQNADGYDDLIVGTANRNVFKYLGSSGGLNTPTGAFYTATSAIVGVKFGQVSASQSGLEVVIAFGTTVRILTGYASTGTVIYSALPSYGTGNAIYSLGVGDVNGDGYDDVVVGTGGTKVGEVWFWANLNNGLAWTSAVQIDDVGATVYSVALGDASNAQYVGR